MIDFDTPGQKRPDAQDGNIGAWLKDNKVLVGIVAVVLVALAAFFVLRPGGDPQTSSPMGTATSPGVVANGDPSDSQLASPSPSSSPSGSADPSAEVDPATTAGEAPSDSSVAPSVAPGVDTEIMLDPEADYEMAPEVQDPKPVVDSFGASYLEAEGGKDAWLERMQPTLTESLYDDLTYTAEEFIIDDEVRLINYEAYRGSGYEIQFEVIGVESGPVMEGMMMLQPDGSWLVGDIYEPGTLEW